MSRIGKKPVAIPAGVTVEVSGAQVKVKGPKGEVVQSFDQRAIVSLGEDEGVKVVNVAITDINEPFQRALWGTVRALIANAVKGVTEGYSKVLELNGVGYRVNVKGSNVVLTVGFSHDVEIPLPAGITAKVEKTTLTLSGIDRQVVGEVAARVRAVRPPEPYLGKGIKYSDEVVRRKAGKAAGKAAA